LSAIIEFKTPLEKIPLILSSLVSVSKEIDTVFSVGMITRWTDGEMEVMPYLNDAGVSARSNGKHNVGIGRPGYD
jgi:hypothetical protein